MAISERLRAVGIVKSTKEVKKKIQNMSNKYRLLTRTGTKTGSGGMEWKFYWDIHRFLGSLPANDSTLMEESGCSAIAGTSPEELFNGMVHGGVGQPPETPTDSLSERSSDCQEVEASPLDSGTEEEPAAPTATAAKKKRLAPPTKLLSELLEEQRQLRCSLERHRTETVAIQRERLEILKRSEAREEKLLDIMQKMYK
ncbi:uncharacterized protein LOC142571144 [Dermacentor variabilis]|uniref:uncharacterized protein LOC142571144 n=1 Tax=Dermacentor variabilis TaxID=34621 RepID=UPI003F5BE0D8